MDQRHFEKKELEGFKKLYSAIIPNHFLHTWVSDDEEYMIEIALRGGGFNIIPMNNDPMSRYHQTLHAETIYLNIPTLDEAVQIYNKRLK